MPQKPRTRKPRSRTIDKATIDRMRDDGLSYRTIAKRLGSNYAKVYRTAHPQSLNGVPSRDDAALEQSSLDTVQSSAVYSAVPVQTEEELAILAQRLTALETNTPQRVDALEAWVATLQARFSASGPSLPPVQSSAVQSAAPHFDDPADAKAERWNIWIPRGLRKRIEAQAAMLGVSASRHLQTILWRALSTEGVHGDE